MYTVAQYDVKILYYVSVNLHLISVRFIISLLKYAFNINIGISKQVKRFQLICLVDGIKGSQLAKMKKSIPGMSLP